MGCLRFLFLSGCGRTSFPFPHYLVTVRNQTISPTSKNTSELFAQANRLRQAGDWVAAEDSYRHALALDPRHSDAWIELGCLLLDSRRFAEAAECFRHVHPSDGQSETGAIPDEAVRLLADISAGRPEWTTGQFSLGCAYEHLGHYDQARIHLRNALRLDPSREAAVQSLYARMYLLEQRYAEAIAAADRALEINPRYFLAHVVRGRACASLARMDEAVESKRSAVEICPNSGIHSDLLFEMNYLPATTPESLYQESCRWNSLYAAALSGQVRPHSNTPDPDRRLKLGYVSPDLCNHPIMRFLLPVLEHHDRSRFQVCAYAVGLKTDQWTERVRQNVAVFQSIGEPEQLAAQVRQDQVDILVDLAGHTMGAAFLAFAQKPAPVQVSWLGALATTGMSAIDYFLGDPYMPCPGTEQFFAERVYRLPLTQSCYRPFRADLPVAPAPSLQRGYITFGCFNNPQKISRDVVKLWSAILHLAPQSRLLLKFRGMETEALQNRYRCWFQEDGIEAARLLFAGQSPAETYLADFASIDIALDPFPYNGGSTTLDALWMGVPVVTLAGRLAVQRDGASILSAAGLADFVAQTPEQYIKIALFLAAVIPRKPELRPELRHALAASPLMDEAGFVRDVENAYRDMWRAWCGAKNP